MPAPSRRSLDVPRSIPGYDLYPEPCSLRSQSACLLIVIVLSKNLTMSLDRYDEELAHLYKE